MDIKCERCGQIYEVGPEYAGKKVHCECGEEIIVQGENIYHVVVKRNRFFSKAEAVFIFDFTSGTWSISGDDADFYAQKIDSKSFVLKNFPVSIFGLCAISEIFMSETYISTGYFFKLLTDRIISDGGFIELNSGRGDKHIKRDSVRLYEDYISIQHKGTLNILTEMGVQGGKQVLLDNITAIQIKSLGFTAGYLQFSIKGEIASKGGVFSAVGDENTITTYGEYGSLIASTIRDYIFNWQRAHRPVKSI